MVSGRRRAGASRLGCLLQLILVVGVGYVAFQAGGDALNYFRFQDAMRQEANFAEVRSDAEIRARLKAFTDSVKIPAEAKEQINVVRDGNNIRIWSEYDQVIKLPLNRQKIIHLRPSVERNF